MSAALRLTPASRLALVGAGGKTTALYALARQFPTALVTTTTHLAKEQIRQADHHYTGVGIGTLVSDLPTGVVAVTGGDAGDGRLDGVSGTALEALRALAEARGLPLLVEADGARMRPLKAPAEHEPAIPPFVDEVLVVAGLSALGKPLGPEWVHRPERFAILTGLAPGASITPAALAQVFLHPDGGLKNIPSSARRVALLNQADSPELQAAACKLAGDLLSAYHAVVIASRGRVYAVHERVAGVILAAGEARRFGRPKQVLEWDGEALVRRAARLAFEAGLDPVVAVTGAHAELVEASLQGLPLRIAKNADWQAGQSASLRAGLEAVPPETGAVIFLLADQPYVSTTLLRGLVEMHAGTLAPIVAPMVDGQRGNPVLFDRATFDELRALSGDAGGRQLFARYPITWLPWHDASVLVDIDTVSDLAELR